MRPLPLVAVLALLTATSAAAQTRTYAGSFTSRWRTVGQHGHNQPLCGPISVINFPQGGTLTEYPDCNMSDFARGNLDDSIGFRAGIERDFLRLGPVSFVGGVEGAMSYTEYNISQADFTFATGVANAGVDLRLGHVTLGGRIGGGPFITSDRAETGYQVARGLHLTLPLSEGVGVRISRQTMKVLDFTEGSHSVQRRTPRAAETSILLVASPDFHSSSRWEYSAATGTTSPGGPLGGSRALRKSTYTSMNVYRALPWHDLQATISINAAAHESTVASTFRGYDGNFRSKTINAFGLGVGRALPLVSRLSLRYGASMEVADWRDENGLLTRNRLPLEAGVEFGAAADVAVRWQLMPHIAFESSLQRVYWRNIDLGETRTGFGIVVTH